MGLINLNFVFNGNSNLIKDIILPLGALITPLIVLFISQYYEKSRLNINKNLEIEKHRQQIYLEKKHEVYNCVSKAIYEFIDFQVNIISHLSAIQKIKQEYFKDTDIYKIKLDEYKKNVYKLKENQVREMFSNFLKICPVYSPYFSTKVLEHYKKILQLSNQNIEKYSIVEIFEKININESQNELEQLKKILKDFEREYDNIQNKIKNDLEE